MDHEYQENFGIQKIPLLKHLECLKLNFNYQESMILNSNKCTPLSRTKDHGYFDNFTLVQYREEYRNLGYLGKLVYYFRLVYFEQV